MASSDSASWASVADKLLDNIDKFITILKENSVVSIIVGSLFALYMFIKMLVPVFLKISEERTKRHKNILLYKMKVGELRRGKSQQESTKKQVIE